MNYQVEKHSGILREIFGEEEYNFPFGKPKSITITKIRMQLDNGQSYETISFNHLTEEYKNKSITLEEISKVNGHGVEIFKEKLTGKDVKPLVTSIRLREKRIFL